MAAEHKTPGEVALDVMRAKLGQPTDPELLAKLRKAAVRAAVEPVAGSVDATLAERGKRYGDFTGHAVITQELKNAMARGRRWPELPPDMRESLEMIVHKIGRILNGDPSYADSWHDIGGYAKLVEDRLVSEAREHGDKTQT